MMIAVWEYFLPVTMAVPITASASAHRPKMSKKLPAARSAALLAGQVVADVGADRVLHVEVIQADAGEEQDGGEDVDQEFRQPRVEENGKDLGVLGVGAEAEVQACPPQQRDDQCHDQTENREDVADDLGLLGGVVVSDRLLVLRQGVDAVGGEVVLLDVLVCERLPADLSAGGRDEEDADDDAEEKGKPPAGAAADVREGL